MSTFDNPFDPDRRLMPVAAVAAGTSASRAPAAAAGAPAASRSPKRRQALRGRRRLRRDARDVSAGRRAARVPEIGRRLDRAGGDVAVLPAQDRDRSVRARRAAGEEGPQGRLHPDHLRDADHHGGADGLLCQERPERRSHQDRGLGRHSRQDHQQGIRRGAHAVADAARHHAGRSAPTAFPTRCRRSRTSTARRSRLPIKHKDKRDPKDWKGFKFAVPFDYSMHNYLLRYYLAEHGLDPDTDVQIRAVPPPEMVANLRADNIDGFLGPDPINQRAVYDGVGFIHILSKDIWEGHPCCAFAATKEFITAMPNTYGGAARAIIEATAFAHEGGEPQADCGSDRAGELHQPAADRAGAGPDRHLCRRSRQRRRPTPTASISIRSPGSPLRSGS